MVTFFGQTERLSNGGCMSPAWFEVPASFAHTVCECLCLPIAWIIRLPSYLLCSCLSFLGSRIAAREHWIYCSVSDCTSTSKGHAWNADCLSDKIHLPRWTAYHSALRLNIEAWDKWWIASRNCHCLNSKLCRRVQCFCIQILYPRCP